MKTEKRLICVLALLLLLFSGCGDAAPAEEKAALPPAGRPDCRITLLLHCDEDGEDIAALLRSLPRLQRVCWRDCPLSLEEQKALSAAFPQLRFVWEVELFRQRSCSNVRTLDLSEYPKDMNGLLAALPLFDCLETVELGDWEVSPEEFASLRALAPDTLFYFGVTVYGQSFSSADEEIDLSGTHIEDTAELEAALPLFQRLKRVRMLECGPGDETMDALNQKYAPIRFIWVTQVFCHGIATDSTYYTMYNALYYRYPGVGIGNFRYCTDLEALDLGHSGAFTKDLDFLAYTPHMRWLILGECHVDDLTPLSSLKELEYLELFLNPCTDLTPLLECPALTDLNLCYSAAVVYADNTEVFKQMKQLQRLWIYGASLSYEQIAELQEALPECEIAYGWGPESTGGGWRQHEHYYAMRDAMHMYYMN